MSRALRSNQLKVLCFRGEETGVWVQDGVLREGLHWRGVYCGSPTLQLLRFCDGA